MAKLDDLIYLDTYVIQKDMRLRLPKTIIQNMNIVKGETVFDIYMKSDKSIIVLKIKEVEDIDE
ncbi:MAG: AbrB/MazE/SpoVT family DNA-binding domain-containing protein [Clostridia bacterium]|nr:AbrB/MazE/SpoVT family DNA-binding domain-containing protein [Clostridia bacterium]